MRKTAGGAPERTCFADEVFFARAVGAIVVYPGVPSCSCGVSIPKLCLAGPFAPFELVELEFAKTLPHILSHVLLSFAASDGVRRRLNVAAKARRTPMPPLPAQCLAFANVSPLVGTRQVIEAAIEAGVDDVDVVEGEEEGTTWVLTDPKDLTTLTGGQTEP